MTSPQKFRIEQQVKSGLGQLHWLPAGDTYPTQPLADAAAAKLEARTNLPTRVVEVPF
jgi:hypothetical protein